MILGLLGFFRLGRRRFRILFRSLGVVFLLRLVRIGVWLCLGCFCVFSLGVLRGLVWVLWRVFLLVGIGICRLW